MSKRELELQKTYAAHNKIYQHLQENNLILFSAISGSQAYSTNTPASDIDRKFVYIAPLEDILIANHSDKSTNKFIHQLFLSKDHTGYEISRYLDLLSVNNPTVMELLWQDDQTIEYVHPLFKELLIDNRDMFLTKKTFFSFGKYASDQIKKARGGNKKMMKPMAKKRKTPLDFCFYAHENGSKPIKHLVGEYQKFLWIDTHCAYAKLLSCI